MTLRKTREQLDEEMIQQDSSSVSTEPSETTNENPCLSSTLALEEPVDTIQENNTQEEPLSEKPSFQRLKIIVESLLFAAGEPVSIKALLDVTTNFIEGLGSKEMKEAVEGLRVDLREQGRGIRIAEVAGGYQLRTPSEASPYIKKMVTRRPPRLTRATLETLAIVAYRQPVTRGDVDELRGVDSGAVLKHLLQKKLIKILGRKDEPGKPLLYGTTRDFLAFFSLKDLSNLPTLKEFIELSEEHRQELGLRVDNLSKEEEKEEKEIFQVQPTDAYTPIGEDEIVNELSEVLTEVKERNLRLRNSVFGSDKKKDPVASEEQGPPEEVTPEVSNTKEEEEKQDPSFELGVDSSTLSSHELDRPVHPQEDDESMNE